MFTAPQATLCAVPSSFTMNLSLGDRPGAIGVTDQGPVCRQLRFIAPDGVFDQDSRRKIEMSPAFTQQLGYVADVQSGSHEYLLK